MTVELGDENRPWTEEEIQASLKSRRKTAAEIAKSDVIGAWSHKGITDSTEWVREVRKKEQEQRL